MQGALIFAEVCDLDDAVCIDVNSAYPNAMRNTGFSVPMKQGDFSRITEFPEFITFGIYRCIIKKSGNKHTDKLFRFNKTNKYSHIDIANAKQLGLKVTLILDDEANCLLYGGGKRINGSRLFKSFIDFLYPMKCNGVEFAKKLLNVLWGALCERAKVYKALKEKFVTYQLNTKSLIWHHYVMAPS
jgi:hypothetical protein